MDFWFCLLFGEEKVLGSWTLSTDHIQLPFYEVVGQENTNTFIFTDN